MALTDINFSQGEGQDFTVEVPLGALNAPDDILIETGSAQYPVVEVPEGQAEGDIFILND